MKRIIRLMMLCATILSIIPLNGYRIKGMNYRDYPVGIRTHMVTDGLFCTTDYHDLFVPAATRIMPILVLADGTVPANQTVKVTDTSAQLSPNRLVLWGVDPKIAQVVLVETDKEGTILGQITITNNKITKVTPSDRAKKINIPAGKQLPNKGIISPSIATKDISGKCCFKYVTVGGIRENVAPLCTAFTVKVYDDKLVATSDLGEAIVEGFESIGKAIEQKVIKPSAEFYQAARQIAGNWYYSMTHPDETPVYCKFPSNLMRLPTIDDPTVAARDNTFDTYNALIKKYAPVFYLHSQEQHLPIHVEELFLGGLTWVQKKPTSAELKNEAPKEPTQKITPESTLKEANNFASLYKMKNKYDNHICFGQKPCVKWGSNPAINRDAQGVLNYPVYVAAYGADAAGNVTTDQSKITQIVLQYITAFGFNKAYNILGLPDDVAEFQNAHETDFEHSTLILDPAGKLQKIYFGSHGRYEGFWFFDAHHKDVKYENGHPVIYIALGGHGHYPKAGTWVRIYGVANDHTNKGQRWDPKLVRVYQDTDPRFTDTKDPQNNAQLQEEYKKLFGWVYFTGSYGCRGVSPLIEQSWFFKSKAGEIGRDYGNPGGKTFLDAPYCPPPISTGITGVFEQDTCLIEQIPFASPPK